MSFIFMLMFLLPVHFHSQDTLLPLNESGKIVFQEDIYIEEMGKEALFRNALTYTSKIKRAGNRKARKPRLEKDRLSQEGSFYVFKKGLFTDQIHGEIRYTLEINVSPQGYTYSFSDFVFQFYKRNRYGKFAPVSGKIKPLEEERYAGMQDEWMEYKKLTRKVIDNHIRVLKKEMQQIPPGAKLDRQEAEEGSN